jgi:uncharacterized protein
MSALVGRRREQRTLQAVLGSREAELVCVYGRRRVGKTFLVRQFFAKELVFELTGVFDAPLQEQLRNFGRAFCAAFGAETAPPSDWPEAFARLGEALDRLPKRSAKRVVFLDELPWLCSRRSGFLRALEHFWNAWAVKKDWLVLVVCGSAAAWMIERILTARGGLHNRVTRRVRLEPFTLAETREFLASRRIDLGDYQTIELYMAIGGVPHYLKEIRRSESASQYIDRICFARDGALHDEFRNVYRSLFEHAERHETVVRALARKTCGMTRNELLEAAQMGSGGAATTLLDELEASGFLLRVPAFGMKTKDAVYRLVDEYSLFYLRWIERHRGSSDGFWVTRRTSPAWRAWGGLAFESVCLKHGRQIKRALGIEAVETLESTWRSPPLRVSRSASSSAGGEGGAQIDLLIDRADATINLCEMKFSEAEFVVDKRYAAELRSKRDAFRRTTASKKTLLLTMVTTYGVRENAHRDELIAASVEMGALFAP